MDGADLVASLRAGVAIYNAGHYHAAHDAWEDRWLDLAEGSDDELLLHGLIQFTAAVHHARQANWPGATGLATSAREYLAGVPADYRGMNLGDVRQWLADLERDPEVVERRPSPELRHEGHAPGLADLEFPAAGVAATVLAEAGGHDESTVERAVEYAATDLAGEHPTSPFVSLVLDFVRSEADREVILQRLSEHVRRREGRESDVEGLFDG